MRLNLSEQGEKVWFQDMIEKRYRHLTEDSWTARCDDPNDYLALFAALGELQYAGRSEF